MVSIWEGDVGVGACSVAPRPVSMEGNRGSASVGILLGGALACSCASGAALDVEARRGCSCDCGSTFAAMTGSCGG